MKKLLITLACFLIIAAFGATSAFAEIPEGWVLAKDSVEESFTINEDGSITIASTFNNAIMLDREITGDFILEVKVTAPAVDPTVDQKSVISVMGSSDNWMTGYWCRVLAPGVEFNDGTDNSYTVGAPTAYAAINTDGFNTVKVVRTGDELTYFVNGTEVGTFTPAVTTGTRIFLGANFYCAKGNEAAITETVTFRAFKLTVGDDVYTDFGYTDEDENTSEPASSETASSEPAQSSQPASSTVTVPSLSDGDDDGNPTIWIILGALGVVIIGAVVVFFILKGKKKA